jgi:AbrB family looped-hinge helix DNA binding protein
VRSSSIMSSKGRIVIPANLRKRYGLKEGTTVVFQEDRRRLVLEPRNYAAVYALQGSLADFPLAEELARQRRAERESAAEPLCIVPTLPRSSRHKSPGLT